MKKMMLIVMSTAAFMLSTNSMAKAPKSINKEVQKLVIQIAKEALANKLAPVLYPQVTGVPISLLGTKVTYKDLKAKAAKDADAKKVIDVVDAKVAKTKMTLSDIKTDKLDDKANKSEFSADLTVGKKILMVIYTAQINKDGRLYVKVSGLEHIYDKDAALDLTNVKVLPFTKKAAKQLNAIRSMMSIIARKRKDEFETAKEFTVRINKDKIKAYQSFFKNSIVKQNIFVVTCDPSRRMRLSFSMKPTAIHCNDLLNEINYAREMQVDNLLYNSSCIKNAAEVDFAGVVKTKKDQVKGYQAFKCTIPEAKQIKKNLGNSWYCNMKLWLKMDLTYLNWKIVKVCVVPVKKR